MCACTCVVTQHMTSTQRTPKSSRTWQMARRRAVGNEPKGDVGEYSTISRKNIICKCNNSREIKDFTKNILLTFEHLINIVIIEQNWFGPFWSKFWKYKEKQIMLFWKARRSNVSEHLLRFVTYIEREKCICTVFLHIKVQPKQCFQYIFGVHHLFLKFTKVSHL